MKAVIYIKTEKEVKENARKLAKKLGISLSDVINASLRNFISSREVVFSDTPRMTPELEELLDKVEEDIKKKRNISPSFSNMEDAIKYLEKQW